MFHSITRSTAFVVVFWKRSSLTFLSVTLLLCFPSVRSCLTALITFSFVASLTCNRQTRSMTMPMMLCFLDDLFATGFVKLLVQTPLNIAETNQFLNLKKTTSRRQQSCVSLSHSPSYWGGLSTRTAKEQVRLIHRNRSAYTASPLLPLWAQSKSKSVSHLTHLS